MVKSRTNKGRARQAPKVHGDEVTWKFVTLMKVLSDDAARDATGNQEMKIGPFIKKIFTAVDGDKIIHKVEFKLPNPVGTDEMTLLGKFDGDDVETEKIIRDAFNKFSHGKKHFTLAVL